MNNTHEFAVYIDKLSALVISVAPNGQLIIDDEAVYNRITRVLRLRTDEQCILFDQYLHVSFLIKDFQLKRRIIGTLISKKSNQLLSPHITFMLPLLKRENLDAAVYSLVEVGVNIIQLIITDKVQRAWRGEKEFARLQRVMIAAAEQSKNFAFPELLLPVSFDKAIEKIKISKASTIFFDPSGLTANEVITQMQQQKPQELMLIVGPEGDLTMLEKTHLKQCGVLFSILTPTILRAHQAVMLSSGLFRSLL